MPVGRMEGCATGSISRDDAIARLRGSTGAEFGRAKICP
jgi:hypothetical protein